jgi:hypothetical protein
MLAANTVFAASLSNTSAAAAANTTAATTDPAVVNGLVAVLDSVATLALRQAVCGEGPTTLAGAVASMSLSRGAAARAVRGPPGG